jgi:uncharacterized repeat protein (TIGR02543 family)
MKRIIVSLFGFFTMLIFISCDTLNNETIDSTAPGIVSSMNVSAFDGDAVITWTMPDDADLAGVEISSEPAHGTLASPVNLGRNVTSLSVSGLTIGTEYTFKIRTFDTSLNYSTGVTFISVVQDTKDYEAPGDITDLRWERLDKAVYLSWTDPLDEDLFAIEISYEKQNEYKPRNIVPMLDNSVFIAPKTQSYIINNLLNDFEYKITIKAIDISGNKSAGYVLNIVPKKINNYLVVFDTGNIDFYCISLLEEGEKVIEPETPVKTGYLFKGWYCDSLFENAFDFDTPVQKNIHLYGKFIEDVKYAVTFNTNGGSEVESQQVLNGLTATEPTSSPTKDKYIFKGWYTDSSFTSPFDFDSAITSNTTIYAKWNKIHTVSFETNGGSEIESQKVENGFSVVIPQNNPTKYKYVFIGWYTTNELTVKFDFASEITSDTIIYAKWEDVLVVDGSRGLDYEFHEETSYEIVDDYYQEITRNVCTITGIGDCTDSIVYIPKSIDGCIVKTIGAKAFDNCTSITGFVISSSITTIENRAFQYCTGITEITIPETVSSIGDQIFYGCSSLNTIYCNSEAGNLSMWQNPSVRKVVFGDNLTIVPGVFRNCNHIEEIVLSKNTQSLGERSDFEGCTSLTYIDFPEGLSDFGWYMFENCGLTYLKFPTSTTILDNFTRTLPNLEYIIVPASLRYVLGQSFDCTSGYKTFYLGTQNDWDYISISEEASSFKADVYFYSETQPTEDGKWWHYDSEGEPVIWE